MVDSKGAGSKQEQDSDALATGTELHEAIEREYPRISDVFFHGERVGSCFQGARHEDSFYDRVLVVGGLSAAADAGLAAEVEKLRSRGQIIDDIVVIDNQHFERKERSMFGKDMLGFMIGRGISNGLFAVNEGTYRKTNVKARSSTRHQVQGEHQRQRNLRKIKKLEERGQKIP